MILNQEIRIGVFDINGTIHTAATGIPEGIEAGFENLHQQGVDTTVITGRGLQTAKALIGEAWPSIVSEGMPLSLENGSRLTSPDGRNISHHPMEASELTAVIDGVRGYLEQVRYVAYYPEDPRAGASLWASEFGSAADFVKQHGEYEDFCPSIESFVSQLIGEKVSMIVLGGDQAAIAGALPESNIVGNGAELNVLSHGIDKAKGVLDLAEYLGVELPAVMVAGNDFNDLSMLALGVGKKIFVDGALDDAPAIDELEIVSDTQSLGRMLAAAEKRAL